MIQRCAYAEGWTYLSAALRLTRQLRNQALEATVRLDIGSALTTVGASREGLRHAEEALLLYRAARNRHGEASALHQVGWEHALLGDYDAALDYCAKALALFRAAGDRASEAATLDSLGGAHLQLDHRADAVACYRQAIDVQGDAGDLDGRAEILTHLGDALQAAGDSVAARAAWQQALAILEDLHHPSAEKVRSKLDWLPFLRDGENGPGLLPAAMASRAVDEYSMTGKYTTLATRGPSSPPCGSRHRGTPPAVGAVLRCAQLSSLSNPEGESGHLMAVVRTYARL
jgi:tetratricopeptide (TPR) repeat protein